MEKDYSNWGGYYDYGYVSRSKHYKARILRFKARHK